MRTNHYPIFINQYMYMLLFVLGLSYHLRIKYSHGDVIIISEGLQILTYAGHSWPLNCEGSLVLLWHGASVYNGHLRGPVTPSSIAERLAVEMSLPVFTTWICRGWESNTHAASGDITRQDFRVTSGLIFWYVCNLPLAGLTQNMHQRKSVEKIPAKFEITVNK